MDVIENEGHAPFSFYPGVEELCFVTISGKHCMSNLIVHIQRERRSAYNFFRASTANLLFLRQSIVECEERLLVGVASSILLRQLYWVLQGFSFLLACSVHNFCYSASHIPGSCCFYFTFGPLSPAYTAFQLFPPLCPSSLSFFFFSLNYTYTKRKPVGW